MRKLMSRSCVLLGIFVLADRVEKLNAGAALKLLLRHAEATAWSRYDPGRMRSLTDGICKKLLNRLRHKSK